MIGCLWITPIIILKSYNSSLIVYVIVGDIRQNGYNYSDHWNLNRLKFMDWKSVEKNIPASAETTDFSTCKGMSRPAAARLLNCYTQTETLSLKESMLNLDGTWQRGIDRTIPSSETMPSLPSENIVWETIQIPDRYGMDERLSDYHGPVWYRRKITRPNDSTRLTLHFDSVDYLADVYLDQLHLGRHEGYFAPFQFDLSDQLDTGETNLLIVRTQDPLESAPENEYFPRIRKQWIKGSLSVHPDRPGGFPGKPTSEWKFARAQNPATGGLTGSVNLISTGNVRIDAIFATPLTLNGDLHLALLFNNDLPEFVPVDLALQVKAPDGIEDTSILNIEVPSGDSRLDLETHFATPVVWNDVAHLPEMTPAPLYTLTAGILQDTSITVHQTIRFGFRLMDWNTTPTLHFELNAQKQYLRGVNFSPSRFGTYFSSESCRSDLQSVLDANLNTIGLSAHIQSPLFYDLADQMGIFVQQEFPLYGAYASSEEENPGFTDKASRMAAEMVYKLWNHPSVISYTLHSAPPYAWQQQINQLYTVEASEAKSLKEKLETKTAEFRLSHQVFPVPQPKSPQSDELNQIFDQVLEKAVLSINSPACVLSYNSSGQIMEDLRGSGMGGDLNAPIPTDRPLITQYGSVHIFPSTSGYADSWAYPWSPDRSRINILTRESWHWMELLETVGAFERYDDQSTFAHATEQKAVWMAKYRTEMYRIKRDQPYSGYRWGTFLNDHDWISYGLCNPEHEKSPIYKALKDASRYRLVATNLPNVLITRGDQVLPVYLINDTDHDWQTLISWRLDRLKKCDLITSEPNRSIPRWLPHLQGSVVLPRPGILEEIRRGEFSGKVASQSSVQIGVVRQSFTRYGAYQLTFSWMENGETIENDFTFLVTPDRWEPVGGLTILDSAEFQKQYSFKY